MIDKDLDEDTRLLPKTQKTRNIIEKNEMYLFGLVPNGLRENVFDLSKVNNSKVLKIVCGESHCMILFADSQIGGFGANNEGQLGVKLLKHSDNYVSDIAINQIPLLQMKDSYIMDLAAGDNFTLALIKINNKTAIYKFGISREEKYMEDFENISTIVIFYLKKNLIELDYDKLDIRRVFASGSRAMFITSDNGLYVGGVDFQMLSMEKFKNIYTFPFEIKDLSLGLEHCLILDSI